MGRRAHWEQTLTPLLGKTYPLTEIVEAHRFVEGDHKRGGVAINISG